MRTGSKDRNNFNLVDAERSWFAWTLRGRVGGDTARSGDLDSLRWYRGTRDGEEKGGGVMTVVLPRFFSVLKYFVLFGY